MPQPPVHLLSTTFRGTIGSTDTWETVLWWLGGADSDQQQTLAQNMADDADARFRTLWDDGLGVLNASDTTYDSCVARSYHSSQTAASAEAVTGSSSKVGSGAGFGPQSQCCVVSLATDVASRSGRGRSYMPATAALHGIDPNHAFSQAEVDALADAFDGFLTSMAGVSNISPAPALVVRSLTTGQANLVTSIRVDNRPDGQEHREKHLAIYRATRPT